MAIETIGSGWTARPAQRGVPVAAALASVPIGLALGFAL